MMVKFNGTTSSTYYMPGGGPQGTLLGVLEYLVQCNDNANCLQPDLRFKYANNLVILKLLSLSLPVQEISHPTTVSSMYHRI